MKDGPDIARVAALLGDPARANMVSALLSGEALTAGELAREAGVSPQTASSHLARLTEGGLVVERPSGRHRYFALSDPEIAALVERLSAVAARMGHNRTQPGPKDPALRRARICYDHLAGACGVALFDNLMSRRLLSRRGDAVGLTAKGEDFMAAFGIDTAALAKARRPVCRPCLDWSERRTHLAGSLGAALLSQFIERSWLARQKNSRAVTFTAAGKRSFAKQFGTE